MPKNVFTVLLFVRLTLEVLLLELLSFSLFGGGGGGALEGEDPGATKGLAGTSGGRTPLPPLPPFELPEAVLLLGDESESALPLTSALRLTGKKKHTWKVLHFASFLTSHGTGRF